MCVSLNTGAGANHCIAQHTMRANMNAIGKFHPPFEYAAYVDKDIAPANELASLVESAGVGKGYAGFEQAPSLFLLPGTLQFRLLHAAVNAERLPGGTRLGGLYGNAVVHGKR